MTKYKSSVLTCHGEDDNCMVCRFVHHEQVDTTILLHVIQVLDEKLHEQEGLSRNLANLLTDTVIRHKLHA